MVPALAFIANLPRNRIWSPFFKIPFRNKTQIPFECNEGSVQAGHKNDPCVTYIHAFIKKHASTFIVLHHAEYFHFIYGNIFNESC